MSAVFRLVPRFPSPDVANCGYRAGLFASTVIGYLEIHVVGPDCVTRVARLARPLPSVKKYQARLTESGLAAEDSVVLCAEYYSTRDWEQVKSKAQKENLLGKGSRSRISKLLRAVERRILEAPPPLDRPVSVARFLAAERNVPAGAKAQLFLVLAVNDDIALADAYRALVIPAASKNASRLLHSDEISRFLKHAAETRPEIAQWTEQTQARWAQGFRLVMREAGLVASTNKSAVLEIRPPVVRDEVIAFLAHAIADSGVSGWPILRHEVMADLLFTENDALRAARALNDRGWWSYAQSDRIIEFRRNHASLEEWLDHGLGI
jgi:hypothetical protein